LQRIKLILVEDDWLILAAWARLLRDRRDFSLEASMDRSDHLASTVRETGAEVVILDLSVPGPDPFEVIASLNRTCPRVRTVIYTGRPRSEYEHQARLAGAVGLFDKLDPPLQILDKIREVL
jgi:DNA-binding NarL/FixJ family response regulator